MVFDDRNFQRGLLQLVEFGFDSMKSGEHKIPDHSRDRTEHKLSAAQAEAHDGCKPHGCRSGYPDNHAVFPQDGSRTDETYTGKNTEWQAHKIHDGIGIVR